jgi:DNA processing protein
MKDLHPWFALKSVPGIGDLFYKRLIDRFKTPEAVFRASNHDLQDVEGMSSRMISRIKYHRVPESLKRDLDLISESPFEVITLADSRYPALLLQIPDPPPFLYVYGTIYSHTNNIAVVGSRNATPYGISTTKRLCEGLVSLGINVVSGMARGIDTAAHVGALNGKGKTIAVLGSGLKNVYPAQNLKLFHQISKNGAVISEFSLSEEPNPHNFPRRNRIISGLSLGTVIVEASKKSGSLITAHLAAEQGREVFAVPGSIQSFKSAGTHSLIKQGAKLVEHPQDIIEELSAQLQLSGTEKKPAQLQQEPKHPPLSSDELLVLNALGPYPVHIDDIVRNIPLDSGRLSGILLQLELYGLVQQSPGKRFNRKTGGP